MRQTEQKLRGVFNTVAQKLSAWIKVLVERVKKFFAPKV